MHTRARFSKLLKIFRRSSQEVVKIGPHAGSWSAFEKWSGHHVVPKCCRDGGWAVTLKGKENQKNRGRKSVRAMAGPPTMRLCARDSRQQAATPLHSVDADDTRPVVVGNVGDNGVGSHRRLRASETQQLSHVARWPTPPTPICSGPFTFRAAKKCCLLFCSSRLYFVQLAYSTTFDRV